MRILVTGANGFVGAAVVRRAVAAKHEVAALVLPGTSCERLAGLDVRIIEGDVTDARSVHSALERIEGCIHVAGDTSFHRADLSRLRAVNVTGARTVARAARRAGVRRLVHTSSVAAIGYGRDGRPVDEWAPYNWPPGLPYMETKRAGEVEALSAASRSFEVVSLNPATVLGSSPGNPTKSGLAAALRAGQVFALPRGSMTVCDVEDVAAAHVAALERGRSGQRYILGGPHVSYRELFRALAEALGVGVPRRRAPRGLLPAAGAVMGLAEGSGAKLPIPAGTMRLSELHLFYCSERAARALGYTSRPLPEILRRTAGQGIVALPDDPRAGDRCGAHGGARRGKGAAARSVAEAP